MFKTALIALALALSLAACVSEQPQNPPAQANTFHSVTITCDIPVHGAPPGTIISVPVGKKPTDFCPATAITTHYPLINDAARPDDSDSVEVQQDNLRTKPQNKTPGQETPGHPP
jgi:hypothetical protein